MSRKQIDLATYPRRDHFEHFLTMENPVFQVTVQVDISEWLPKLKKAGYPLFLSFQYALIHAANRIPEFRQRIVWEDMPGTHEHPEGYEKPGIVEYDFCNPSYTYGLPDGTYRYCLVNTDQPFKDYLKEARAKEEAARKAEKLEEEGDVLGLLFTSCVPWFGYTSAEMPYPNNHFSIPNILWGRYKVEKKLQLVDGLVVEKNEITIPVTLLANHALVDGSHIARFLANIDEELRNFPFPKTRRRKELC